MLYLFGGHKVFKNLINKSLGAEIARGLFSCLKSLHAGVFVLLLFACQSVAEQNTAKGWQEGELIEKLDIQPYEPFPVALRFFYKKSEPSKSRAEIRTPLLPGAVLFAEAKQELLKDKSQEKDEEKKKEKNEPENKNKDGLFSFPMELSRIAIPLDISLGGEQLYYALRGQLLLRQQAAEQSYFVLERHGKITLGNVQANSDAKANPQAQHTQAQKEEETQNSGLVRDLELFAEQIFQYRILNNMSNKEETLSLPRISSAPSNANAGENANNALGKNTGEASPDVLPLVERYLDDVLTAYFFPEALSAKQQNLLTENQKKALQEKYQIEFATTGATARYSSDDESYTWSPSYSLAVFSNPRFRELRDSGKLWQYFHRYRAALQTLYNLRYTNDLILPVSSVLQREIINKN